MENIDCIERIKEKFLDNGITVEIPLLNTWKDAGNALADMVPDKWVGILHQL